MSTSRSSNTLMPAAASALRAAAPSSKRKCAAPWPWTTHAPPPSTLTPARPRASPMSANAPGRLSSAMLRSFMTAPYGHSCRGVVAGFGQCGLFSPNATPVFFRHGLTRLAGECLLELRHVHHQAVDAILAGRVRIGDGVHAQGFRPLVFTGPLRVSYKETLLRRQPVARLQCHIFGLHLPRHPGENQAAQVGDVFAFGQLAIDLYVVHHHVLRILV